MLLSLDLLHSLACAALGDEKFMLGFDHDEVFDADQGDAVRGCANCKVRLYVE